MENIEYMRGRISAFKEMISLMNLLMAKDAVTKAQINLLIEHANSQIELEESFIDGLLKEMEVDSNGRKI